MAAVSLLSDGVPVTLVMADASEVRMSALFTIERNGEVFHVQTFDDFRMVMTEHSGRWICLMGTLPTERLVNLAEQIR